MELFVKKFDELSTAELYEIIQLRESVFVVEQNCVYLDADGKDTGALHVFLRDEDGIEAYLRVLDRGVSFPEVAIGRVVSKKRRCGLGSELLRCGIKAAKERFGADRIVVEAQTYAKPFYEKQGFVQVSDEFLEDGIPHIKMILEIT